MSNQYDVGRIVRVSCSFTTSTGLAFDPTTVIATIKKPGGVLATYQYGSGPDVVKDTTGQYHVDFEITLAGLWYYRWYSTGALKASSQSYFRVRKVEAQ